MPELSSVKYRTIIVRQFLKDCPTVAWVVLVISLILTGLAWFASDNGVKQRAGERFVFQAQDVRRAIEQRMEEYAMALRGGVGLFNVSNGVSREDWHQFTNTLDLQTYFPGIQGLGYARVVSSGGVSALEASVRAEGFHGFRVRPEGVRDLYSVIDYIEPFDWRNQRAFGFDMYSEPTRREAMDIAVDTGKPAVSGRVTLVQETEEDTQYGFLMYYPLFRTGEPVATVEQRRDALFGYIYSAFRMGDLMRGILGADQDDIDFEIYDGSHASDTNILYNNVAGVEPRLGAEEHEPDFHGLYILDVGGHNWSLYLYSRPGYLAGAEASQPLIVAACGLAFDLLLFLIVANLSFSQQAAKRLASEMTDELRASEERHRLLFTNAGVAMLLSDLEDGSVFDANQAALEFYGYDIDSFKNMTLDGLSPQEPPLHSNQNKLIRLTHTLASGEQRIVELRNGKIDMAHRTLILSIIIDVTRRQQAEDALKASERRYHEVFELAPVPMMLLDRASERFLMINHAAEVHYGYEREDFLRMVLADIVVDECTLQSLTDTRLPCESVHRKHDGSRVRVELTARPIIYQEKEVMIIAVVDVTDRAKASEMLEQARQEAEAISLAKGEFLANMSHEIRTPMNAIVGLSQLLTEFDLPDTARDYIMRMFNASRALLSLLNDILDYSKMDAGRLELEHTEFSLEEVVTRSIDLFAIEAHEKGLSLYLDMSIRLPSKVIGDPLRLGQILNNLIGNAVKFTDQGAVILAVEAIPAGDQLKLVFRITDTGVGMPEAQIPSLFESFSQLDASTTRKYGGTGLGLAICRSLVDLMGGSIEVSSIHGQGSEFRFSVVVDTVPDCENLLEGELSGVSVLMVDSHPTGQRITRELLTSLGAKVSVVSTEEEGLNSPELLQADLILFDSSTRSHWPALAAELERRGRAHHVLLIINSDESAAELIGYTTQPDAVIVKPVTPRRLYAAVLRSLGRELSAESSDHQQSLSGRKVLLVEDQETNRLVACAMLEKLGMSIDIAEDGLEALSLLATKRYDLVLMDLQMPNLDGLEATKRYRASEPEGQHLPIIAVSAAILDVDKAAAAKAGMDDYIMKPLELTSLAATLQYHLNLDDNFITESPALPAGGDHEEPWIQVDKLKQRLGANEASLQRLLRTFNDDLRKLDALLLPAVMAGTSLSQLRQTLHSLKGIAANVEAQPLQRKAAALERQVLDQNSFDSASLEELQQAISGTLECLQPHLKQAGGDRPDHLNAEHAAELEQLLTQIADLVDRHRLVPAELAAKLESYRHLNGAGWIQGLIRAVDGFDYSRAQQILKSHWRSDGSTDAETEG